MPTRNRGKHSNDDKWFADKWLPAFRNAVDDLGYLFSRGYSENSALQIVGNRYKLNKRQRKAILRMSVSTGAIELRKKNRCLKKGLKKQTFIIDGFNLLILLESALSGAYIFKGRDGCFRDISSVHGSYKRVLQTENAMLMVGKAQLDLGLNSASWYLDKPISNSGMLKTKLYELSEKYGFNWEVSLVNNPDKVLAKSKDIVISSDGWILDQAQRWFNLGSFLVENHIPEANVIEA